MSFNAEKEVSKLWKALHSAQSEIGKNYFRWRQVASEFISDKDNNSLDIVLKMAEFSGKDVSKLLLPKLNWLQGEEKFLLTLGRNLANLWLVDGGIAFVEKGQNPSEVFIKCTRDPWPTWAKEYNVSMEELVIYRKAFLEFILKDVSIFFNIPLSIEIKKSIPRGEGLWLIRLYKNDQ